MELRSNWPPLIRDLRHVFAPYRADGNACVQSSIKINYEAVWNAEKQQFELLNSGKLLSATETALDLLAALQEQVFWHWCAQVKNQLLVHATAIARGDEVVLLVAAKHSGKSTVALYCLQQGFTYVADDIVPIDLTTGAVLAEPWPVRVKEEVFPLEPEIGLYSCRSGDTQYAVIDPRWRAERGKRFRVKAIVIPQYNPEGHSQLLSIGQGWGAYKLLRHAFNQPHLGLAGFETASSLAKKTPCFELQHNDLAQAHKALATLFEG